MPPSGTVCAEYSATVPPATSGRIWGSSLNSSRSCQLSVPSRRLRIASIPTTMPSETLSLLVYRKPPPIIPLVHSPMKNWAAPSPGLRCQRSSIAPAGSSMISL